LEDRESGVRLAALDPDMPDDAYLELSELDLTSLPHGALLGWSEERSEWVYRSSVDEGDEPQPASRKEGR